MQIRLNHILAVAVLAAGCASQSSQTETPEARTDRAKSSKSTGGEGAKGAGFDYPKTPRENVVEEVHGTQVRDPYRWLEPSDDERVREWSRAQNDFARSFLDDLSHRSKLRERFEKLYYVDSISAPRRRGDRMFYQRQHPDKEKEVYYWRPIDAPADEEKVLLDPNRMTKNRGENISVDRVAPSWDGELVAYTVSVNNADRATLHVRNVETGEDLKKDVIEGARWAHPSWTPDNRGFYYTRYPTDSTIPKSERPGEADIRFHELGTPSDEDRLVHEATGDPRTFQGAEISRDGNWLVRFVSHGWTRTDIYYRDLREEGSSWKTLVEGADAKFRVKVHDGHFYIRTNHEAPKYALYRVSVDDPARSNWSPVVEESDDAVLDGFRIVGGRLVLSYLTDAHSKLEIRNLDGSNPMPVDLPKLGTAYRVSGQPEHSTAYITFESFKSPKQIYETTVEDGETDLWSRTEVPADLSDLRVRQVWYESKDGTRVSMFVLHRKGLEMSGETPFLMTGYGGFDVSYTPFFIEHVVPWLEAGGGFALPNLRGGGEYGESWHRAGMLANKQNTFDDFIAAAEYLIDEGYTSSDRLAIRGASNGGLLVGAVTTQRPDLFRAVICEVPLLDMVRYTKFGPAKTWIHEYGNPEKQEHFEFLYDYSPYHHVDKGTAYPAVLMLSAASDDRVHPMHARKMTAALQWASSSPRPVLFRLQKKAGHGGADMIEKRVAQETDVYAFLFDQLGLEW